MNALEISTITVLHTISKLNLRELNLLALISKGKPLDEIAEVRGVDVKTVENQINTLIEKFDLCSLDDMRIMLSELNLSYLLRIN